MDYTYYPGGLLKTKTNARGTTATYTYYPGTDDLESVSYSDGTTPSVTYTYDGAYDRVTGIAMSSGLTYAYTYDSEARVRTVDGPWDADTLTYTYDYLGRVSKLEQEGASPVEYVYDTQGRLDKVRVLDPAGTREFDYAYAGSNGTNTVPSRLTRPSGGYTDYTYDNLYRLTNIENRKSDGTLFNSFGYTYNKAHMRETETIEGGVPFDLIEAEKAYTYNGVNQLLTETGGASDCTYDLDGNMTGGYTPDGTRFAAWYDAENRLKKMEYPAGAPTYTAHFYYGPDGFLVKQKVTGTWTRFVNNGGLVLQDRDNSDAVLRTYMWDGVSPGGIGGLLEMNLLAQHYNYLYDGKGNVASVLNNLQAEVAKYRYDGFGSLVASSGTLNQAYRFSTKRYLAGYGVSYFGYRFHVAHLGRWMTQDPIGEKGGLNLYGMVGNSVVNAVDPWGLIGPGAVAGAFPIVIGGGGAAAAGAAAGATATVAVGAAALAGTGYLSYNLTSDAISGTWLDGGIGEWVYNKTHKDIILIPPKHEQCRPKKLPGGPHCELIMAQHLTYCENKFANNRFFCAACKAAVMIEYVVCKKVFLN